MSEIQEQARAKRLSFAIGIGETVLLCAYALGWQAAITVYAMGVIVAVLLVLAVLFMTWKHPERLPKKPPGGMGVRDIIFGVWRIGTIATLLWLGQLTLAGVQLVLFLLSLYAVAKTTMKRA